MIMFAYKMLILCFVFDVFQGRQDQRLVEEDDLKKKNIKISCLSVKKKKRNKWKKILNSELWL